MGLYIIEIGCFSSFVFIFVKYSHIRKKIKQLGERVDNLEDEVRHLKAKDRRI